MNHQTTNCLTYPEGETKETQFRNTKIRTNTDKFTQILRKCTSLIEEVLTVVSPSPSPRDKSSSEDNRLFILRMLEQKKISVEEANSLLATLDE